MQIRLSTTTGGGFVGMQTVRDGITIGQLFRDLYPDANPAHYQIRVNRQQPLGEQVLVENDSVSIVPGKMTGA